MRNRGTSVTIHHSLTDEIMLGGVPRNMAIINATVGAALGIGGGAYYIIPFFVLLHFIFSRLHKNDDLYLVCLRRHYYVNRYYRT